MSQVFIQSIDTNFQPAAFNDTIFIVSTWLKVIFFNIWHFLALWIGYKMGPETEMFIFFLNKC